MRFSATRSRHLSAGTWMVKAGLLAAWLAAGLATARGESPSWQPLFDGHTLGRWRSTPFGGEGEVVVADGCVRIGRGSELSGITWGDDFPTTDYEVSLEARRDDGFDFFCGLTFPVGEESCSFIVGGWGGTVVGLSSIDGRDASDNATTQSRSFADGRWYRVRVRVTAEAIDCFIDDEQVVDEPRAGRRFSVRDEVLPSRPLGIATYATTASLRGIRWRSVESP